MFSPVLFRELSGMSRRRSHYLLRALVIGTILAVIGGAWRREMTAAVQNGVMDYPALAQAFFDLYCNAQLAAVLVLTPGIIAAVVAGERERGTLQLMLLTTLTPGRILVDMLLARLWLLLLLFFAGAPLLVGLAAYGGTPAKALMTPALAIVATGLYVASLALYLSTVLPTVRAAVVATYFSMAAFLLLFCVALEYLTGSWGESISALVDLLHPRAASSGSWVFYCGFAPPVFVATMVRCTERLGSGHPVTQLKLIRDFFEAADRFYAKINFTAVQLMHERSPLRGDPVLWRELHKRFLATSICQLRLFFTLCVIILLLFAVYWPMAAFLPAYLTAVHLLTAAAITMVYAAAAITHERESETLDVLMATPISGSRIVTAKFWGVFKAVSAWTLTPLVLPITADLTHIGESYPCPATLMTLLWIVTVLPGVAITGLYWSVRCRTWLMAFVATAATCAAWYLAPIGLALLLDVRVQMPNHLPVLALWPAAWGYATAKWVVCGVYVAAWIGLLDLLRRRFDVLAGR